MNKMTNLRGRQSVRRVFAVLLVGAFHPFAIELGVLVAAEPPTEAKGKSVPAYITVQHNKPRVRSIHVNKGLVRSGPADKYYVTQTLPRGSQVEVYLETSDGWSAVRPPSGSHDWIPSQVAYLLPGGKTAEIIEQDTPAWIGSESNDISEFMWQTPLAKTQQVAILGEETRVNDEGKKHLWYRIAPPQGEFRWVRTAQLSDSQIAPEAEPTPPAVQSASHQEPIVDNSKVVWSNEDEVLANVDAEIQREQAAVQSQLAKDGIPVSDEDVGIPASKRAGTKIRPIPANPKASKAKAAEHQIDSFKQWDAMQSASNNPKMRVGPINSLLGLVGISVVEAERAPVQTQIARDYHASQRQNQNHLGQVGQVGTSRLDRLPRPGMRGAVPMTTNPPSINSSPNNAPINAAPSNPPSINPYQQPEGTFSRWLHSQEPVFQRGGSLAGNLGSAGMQSNLVMNGMAPMSSSRTPGPQDNSSWHGIAPFRRNSVDDRAGLAGADDQSVMGKSPFNGMVGQVGSNVDEFQTPEIQSALANLTQEIARPTEQWNLTSLRGQASHWIENGATAMIRGEARLLMERIERFESLRQRTLGFANDTSMMAQQMARESVNNYIASMSASSIPTSASGNGVVQASAQSQLQDRGNSQGGMQEGDASGWLVQVHTTNPGQPEFALTDDAGNVIAYVQSTAGLNLRRYLQQPVTVYGLRGYLPSLAAKQIVAERVVRVR